MIFYIKRSDFTKPKCNVHDSYATILWLTASSPRTRTTTITVLGPDAGNYTNTTHNIPTNTSTLHLFPLCLVTTTSLFPLQHLGPWVFCVWQCDRIFFGFLFFVIWLRTRDIFVASKEIRQLAGKLFFRQKAEIFSSKSSPTFPTMDSLSLCCVLVSWCWRTQERKDAKTTLTIFGEGDWESKGAKKAFLALWHLFKFHWIGFGMVSSPLSNQDIWGGFLPLSLSVAGFLMSCLLATQVANVKEGDTETETADRRKKQ